MVKELAMLVTRHGIYFAEKRGISKRYSPQMIVSNRAVDYKKHLIYPFGDYMQASNVNKPSNNNMNQILHCIYLRASNASRGGHVLMDLVTGRAIACPTITLCKMTLLAVERVELLVQRYAYKSLKFLNRKGKHIIFTDAVLKGVERTSVNDTVERNEVYLDLPELLNNDEEYNQNIENDSDEEGGIKHNVDADEVEDLSENTNENTNIPQDEGNVVNDKDNDVQENDNESEVNVMPDQDSDIETMRKAFLI